MQQILIISVFVILTVNIVTAAPPSENEIDGQLNGKENQICDTTACVKSAETILANLDQTVDPCDDFYQFACGGFMKRYEIPEDATSINYFSIIGQRILDQLKKILEKPPTTNEKRPFLLAKKFYNTCLNTTHIEEDGLDTIKGVLERLGGWPVLEGESWEASLFDWKNFTYNSRKIGLPTSRLLTVYIGSDVFNSSRRVISIDQASLWLEREYLANGLSDPVVNAYHDFLVDVAILFGADEKLANSDMEDALNFEIKVAKLTLPKEDRRNVTLMTNPMTIQELQDNYPVVPWQDYLNKILNFESYSVQPNNMVDVGVPKYLNDLKKLLQETPKRIQANYLFNQVVLSSIQSLTKKLRDRKLEFDAIHHGQKAMHERWLECTILSATQFRLAVDALYVRDYVSDDVKINAEELINNLKATFNNMLKEIDWMDENTKKEALEKADLMNARIAYAPELRDHKNLEDYYAMLKPADTLLEFNYNIKKFFEDTKSKKLHQLVSKTDWTENSFVCSVDAYYNVMENSIQLPAGILQGIFFDPDRPNYLNYGSMGFAIGHEITHGFDDQGRQYDKDGNLRDWWAQETGQAFMNKAQCIIDQYSNQSVSELNLNLNGINTQGENVADNGGVKEAYLAYNAWIKRNGEEPRLPGLDYTPKQLFWISTANLWCHSERPEFLRQNILTNSHCPPKYRVIIPLSNSEEFAKDYQCPVGSTMNPKKKCHVW